MIDLERTRAFGQVAGDLDSSGEISSVAVECIPQASEHINAIPSDSNALSTVRRTTTSYQARSPSIPKRQICTPAQQRRRELLQITVAADARGHNTSVELSKLCYFQHCSRCGSANSHIAVI